MFNLKSFVIVLAIVALTSLCFAADPTYQAAPPSGTFLASGIADLSGPGGKAYVEYWAWDGANGYYYYTYQIHNSDVDTPFIPFIKHLTIANPTGEPYIITSSSAGGPAGGVPWLKSTHLTMPTLVDWVAGGPATVLYPGQSSWAEPKFQFASKLPPASAGVTLREGSLSTYANGLIPAPGMASMCPRTIGYWKHQFGTKGARKEAPSLPGYLAVLNPNSRVFDGVTVASGLVILEIPDSSDMRDKAKVQLFAVWLNVVSGKLNYAATVTIKDANEQDISVVVSQVIIDAENAILNAAATLAELENAKNQLESLNTL
jgi:hypothetical protein